MEYTMTLCSTYQNELVHLAFVTIPNEKLIAESFVTVMKNLTKADKNKTPNFTFLGVKLGVNLATN
jgi:hypothetical protein